MESLSPLVKANTAFSVALFKKLSDKDGTANIFYSPFSISSALAMTMLGAGGNTKKQMAETLKTQDLQDEVHTSFSKLLGELHKPDTPYALSVANRLYGEQTYQFVQDYLDGTQKHYGAELETVDFISAFDAARVNINQWVETKTQGKIKDLVAQGVLNTRTRLVLVNTMYFKGNWNELFDEYSTREAQFRLSKNETKTVKMMHQESEFPLAFIPEVNCQVLEMPYEGKELSMLFFLPSDIEDDTTGLEKLEKKLTHENFAEWTSPAMMVQQVVKVWLPRFKLELMYDMNEILKSMGMVDAFDDRGASDFSGMCPAKDLFVSKVVHKAFVEVNEEGTEATAATGIFLRECCLRMTQNFNADHPFLFFIRHNPSQSILFAGRYCSP